jgi:DNA-directed RNA polymerase specialized sigma24 family protein
MALDPAKFKPMVRNVARSVSGQYPSFVTQEDTEQAIWLWLYDKRTSVLQTVEDDPQNWEAKIASTMRKVANDHCAKEKAAVEGYDTSDLYRYSLPKIKELLPDAFEYGDWQKFGLKGDGQPTGRIQANQTGDRIAELVDIRAAVKSLPHDTKKMLYLTHVFKYTADNLADEFDTTEEAMKKRLQRSLAAIQKELGRRSREAEPRRPDRRTVRSNSAWRAAQATQYEG